MLSIETLLCLIGACLIAGLAPFLLRPVLKNARVIDIPNNRSSHVKPTIRGGGAAQLLAIALGGTVSAMTLNGDNALLSALVVSAGVAVGTIGLREDTRGLRVTVRLALQLFIGALLGVSLSFIAGAPWIVILLASVGFAAYVNFANFMDGINAMSSLHGLAAGTSYAALGLFLDQSWLVLSGLLVAAAFASFLPWNLIPPGMFLGDVGSYLLGGALAAICITSISVGVHLIAAVAPLGIYVADTVSTLVRRASKRQPLHQAHREHVYQRLTDSGLSHVTVACLVAAFTIVAAAIGLLAVGEILNAAAAMAAVGALLVCYLMLPLLFRKASKIRPEKMNV